MTFACAIENLYSRHGPNCYVIVLVPVIYAARSLLLSAFSASIINRRGVANDTKSTFRSGGIRRRAISQRIRRMRSWRGASTSEEDTRRNGQTRSSIDAFRVGEKARSADVGEAFGPIGSRNRCHPKYQHVGVILRDRCGLRPGKQNQLHHRARWVPRRKVDAQVLGKDRAGRDSTGYGGCGRKNSRLQARDQDSFHVGNRRCRHTRLVGTAAVVVCNTSVPASTHFDLDSTIARFGYFIGRLDQRFAFPARRHGDAIATHA